MSQTIIHVALVVRDYDEAIDFYCHKLHFRLVEDAYQPEQDKRWVVVAPLGSKGTTLLLARAASPEQETFIGNQSGAKTSRNQESLLKDLLGSAQHIQLRIRLARTGRSLSTS